MKIFCVGRNYAEHARELSNEVPDEPVIFLKPKSALIQPHAHFYYPEFSNELHYEAELVLRISNFASGTGWALFPSFSNAAIKMSIGSALFVLRLKKLLKSCRKIHCVHL